MAGSLGAGMKGNFHRKLFRMDEFGRRYYCQHARLNQLRSDKKAAKKTARRYKVKDNAT